MVKKTKKQCNLIGAWAFLIGVVLAIVIGFFAGYLSSGAYRGILIILVIIGIIECINRVDKLLKKRNNSVFDCYLECIFGVNSVFWKFI